MHYVGLVLVVELVVELVVWAYVVGKNIRVVCVEESNKVTHFCFVHVIIDHLTLLNNIREFE